MLSIVIGLLVGIGSGLLFFFHPPLFFLKNTVITFSPYQPAKKTVIGFLPYWLINRTQPDEISSISELAYFGLRINTDGTIQKLLSPQEEEPGWYALDNGSLQKIFHTVQIHHVALSLLLVSGDIDSINRLIKTPQIHAEHLVDAVIPLVKKYGFSDVNLDIEDTGVASKEAQRDFTVFIKTVKKDLKKRATLTVEVSSRDVIIPNLINIQDVEKIADRIVVMTYDYHTPDSYVTGPVAPLHGAGNESEFDVTTAIEKALLLIPEQKLIMGIPLYGNIWETLGTVPRSAVIPQTGATASNRYAETFLEQCGTCSAQFDSVAQEPYFIYFDRQTGDYHQVFYPDKRSTLGKLQLANSTHIAGIALWALGYEGNTILSPIRGYLNSNN